MYRFLNIFFSPGVVLHELSHALFCLFAGVRIYQVRLFRFGRVAGYVSHAEPQQFYQCFFISFGPLFINSLASLICFARFVPPYGRFEPWVLLWLGAAFGLHAIPSDGDAAALSHSIRSRLRQNPLLVLGYPLVGLLMILNFLKRFRIDFIFIAVLFWLGNIYLKRV